MNREIPNPLIASEPDSFQIYPDLMTQKAALLKRDMQQNLLETSIGGTAFPEFTGV